MMNKKGFTLVELLAVIAIIGILSLIAVPNVIGIVDDNKKNQMLDDAKKAISLAKYKVNIDSIIRDSDNHIFKLKDIDEKGDIKVDPDGGTYDINNSIIEYSHNNNVVTYCVKLIGSKRRVEKNNGCVNEDELNSKSNVVDNH